MQALSDDSVIHKREVNGISAEGFVTCCTRTRACARQGTTRHLPECIKAALESKTLDKFATNVSIALSYLDHLDNTGTAQDTTPATAMEIAFPRHSFVPLPIQWVISFTME